MRAGELNVKLSATGGDQVKRELDKTREAMRETKKEAASATDIIDGFGAATGGLGPIIDNVVSRVGRISSSIGSLGVIGGIATAAIGALAIGFGALQYQTYKFAFDARAAGMDFEAMRQRLEGLTGSAERAASILAVARREAGPSMFTTKQLEEAAVGLAAYGINVERTIPLVTRLGQAFGADQEHLMMYVRAFGQLKQGRLPESEVMGQMGIGRRDLMREGIQFDKSGQLLSSAEATMVAFEKIIYAKFDSAYKKSADTSQAIRASITDAFEDIPRLVTEDLMRPFRMLTGVFADAQDAFAVFVAGLGATVNIIPGMISRTIELFDKLRTGNLQEKALAVLQMRQGLGGAAALAGKDFAARFREYYESLKYQMAAPADVMGTIGQDRSRERFGGDEPLADAGKKADKKQTQTHLQRIEANTRKSADLLDLRNQTIGGGRLAGLGITGPEFAGMGMRVQSDFSRAKPISADTMVNRGIKTMIQNNLGFAVNGGRTMPVR
jgi:hypothetical protein